MLGLQKVLTELLQMQCSGTCNTHEDEMHMQSLHDQHTFPAPMDMMLQGLPQ